MRRDALNVEDSFSLTIDLQSRLDHLRQTMPCRLKEALEDPFSEGRRLVSILIISRAFHSWFELQLHGRHYAKGWTDPKYGISRCIFHRAATSFVSTFLRYWNHLVKRVCAKDENIKLDPTTITETAPGLVFRVSPLAPTAFTLLVQLERHVQLSQAYPHIVSEEERAAEGKVLQLIHEVRELKVQFQHVFTFNGLCPVHSGLELVPSVPSGPMPPLPTARTAGKDDEHRAQEEGDDGQAHRPCSTGYIGPMDLESNQNHDVDAATLNRHSSLDPMPVPGGNSHGDPVWNTNSNWLLEQPAVQPMGTGGPYDNSNGMPMTFEDLFLTFNPIP